MLLDQLGTHMEKTNQPQDSSEHKIIIIIIVIIIITTTTLNVL